MQTTHIAGTSHVLVWQRYTITATVWSKSNGNVSPNGEHTGSIETFYRSIRHHLHPTIIHTITSAGVLADNTITSIHQGWSNHKFSYCPIALRYTTATPHMEPFIEHVRLNQLHDVCACIRISLVLGFGCLWLYNQYIASTSTGENTISLSDNHCNIAISD